MFFVEKWLILLIFGGSRLVFERFAFDRDNLGKWRNCGIVMDLDKIPVVVSYS